MASKKQKQISRNFTLHGVGAFLRRTHFFLRHDGAAAARGAAGREGYFFHCFARRGCESRRSRAAKRVFQRPAARAIGARAASPGVVEKSPARTSFARPPHRDLPMARHAPLALRLTSTGWVRKFLRLALGDPPAQVAELVDALVSGTSGAIRGGSSPLLGTKHPLNHGQPGAKTPIIPGN